MHRRLTLRPASCSQTRTENLRRPDGKRHRHCTKDRADHARTTDPVRGAAFEHPQTASPPCPPHGRNRAWIPWPQAHSRQKTAARWPTIRQYIFGVNETCDEYCKFLVACQTQLMARISVFNVMGAGKYGLFRALAASSVAAFHSQKHFPLLIQPAR